MGGGLPDAFVAGQRDVLEGIATGEPLAAVLERIVRLVEGQATGMACSILLLDLQHGCVRHGAAPSLPAEYSRAIDGVPIGPEAGSCGTAAHRGETVVVEDIATDPLWASYRDVALPHGLRACWSSPIFSADRRVLGTFAMYYREPRGPTPTERQWVSAATHLAAVALGRDRTEQELRESEARYRHIAEAARAAEMRGRRLARLYAVSSSVNEAVSRIREPARLYEHACRIAVDKGLLRLAWVGIHDPASDRLLPVARAGADDGYVDQVVVGVHDPRTGAGPAARAMRTGMPAVVNDIPRDPGFHMQAQAAARGLKACAAFPLSIRGRPTGVLVIYAEQPGYFSDEEVRVLTALAEHIAFGVESADTEAERQRLVHELGERVKELTVLHGAARCLQADRPLDRALLGELVSLLPSGWQYPDDCVARIEWGGVAAQTPGWRPTPWTQSATFTGGGQAGRIDVAYLVARPPAAEGPFLTDERALLQSLADMLSAHADRQQARTELTRSLRELSDANQRLSFHVSRMPLAYIVWSHELLVAEWNPAAARIFGWSASEAIGRHAFELMVPPEAQPVIERRLADLLAGEASARHFVGEGVRRDGLRVVCEWFNAPLLDAGGHVAGYLSMVNDVTERRQAEEERARLEAELRQAQRIQSLGTLAGGIAHDFNNVLTAIAGNVDVAAAALPPDHRAQRSLAHITAACARAGDLVKRILTFSRRQEAQRSVVRLQSVVEEALALLRPSLPAVIDIRTRFEPEAPDVLADPTQVHQVVMNLGTNAAHAMGPIGGRLELGVESVAVEAATPNRPPDLAEGRYVVLSVSDTGCGMDAATQERVFEPFFTTKPVGQGTGLGLSVVHGIMKSHEGAIAVDSRPGAGTTFRLYFPVADAGVLAATTPPPPVEVRGRGEHVVYVDDEEAVVYMAGRILERLGYRVSGFTDARQALDAIQARPDTVDAVVTDLAMPGLSGLELAHEVRRLRPDVPIVLTSGYVRAEDVPALQGLPLTDFMHKPDSVTGLGPALHRLLAARARRTPA